MPQGNAGENANTSQRCAGNVLGLDLSLTATGYAVLGTDGDLLDYDTICPPVRGVERLVYIDNSICGLLHTYNPILVVLEGYAYAKGQGAHQIGELGGVIRRRLHIAGVSWIEVAPSQVKQFATGKGNSPKELVLLHVYKRWGVELATDHEADAYAIARIGVALLAAEEADAADGSAVGVDGLTRIQMQVLDRIRSGGGIAG